MSILILPSAWNDAARLAPRLRADDLAEVRAHGREALEALERAYHLSAMRRTIYDHDNRPIAMFGFAPVQGQTHVAAPWLLASDELTTTHRRWFIRNTQRIVTAGDQHWTWFYNLVDSRNTAHVRWLEWAGFKLDPPVTYGPQGVLFHPFHRTTTDV